MKHILSASALLIALIIQLSPLTLSAATTLTLLTPVSITATGGGQDVDVSRLAGQARITLATLNTAGTNPTLACKLQGSAAATRGLDYQVTSTTNTKLRSGASTNTKLSLKFTQSGTASVKRVALRLKYNGTITAGKLLTLTINSDSSGSPSATVLGTAGTVDINTYVPTSNGWVVFTFTNPVDLTDATVYHLVLAGDYTADTTNNVTWASTTVGSGGTLETSTDGSTWAAVTTTEKFLAYVDQYSFADISGGGFTTVSTAGGSSVQTLELPAIELLPVMRLYSTIGGTSNPAFATTAIVNSRRAFEQ